MRQSKRPLVAVQLWSVRKQMESDMEKTLARLAQIGFEGVETAFLPEGVSPSRAGRLIRAAGLRVISCHCELPIGEHLEAMLELAGAYQCSRMVWHGWPEDLRYRTEAGIQELSEIYNQSCEVARSHGLHFGLHNHWWEFEKHPSGRTPVEVLLERLNDEVFLEVDTYWAKVGGADPAHVVARLGRRARLLHLKDGPGTRDDPMVALGTGILDIPAILRSSAGSAEVLIVEFDECAGDIFAELDRSLKFLKSQLAS